MTGSACKDFNSITLVAPYDITSHVNMSELIFSIWFLIEDGFR